MFIKELVPKARERLVTIRGDIPLMEAAKLLPITLTSTNRFSQRHETGRRAT